LHTLIYVPATAYILLAIGCGYYCGRIFRGEFLSLSLGAVALLFVALLVGLNHDQVAVFWQVLVGGIACFFLTAGTMSYIR